MDNRKGGEIHVDSLGYREITLKRDTEPAIIAFRNQADTSNHPNRQVSH